MCVVRRPTTRRAHACVECVVDWFAPVRARPRVVCTVESGVCGSSYVLCVLVGGEVRCMNGASPGGLVSFVFFISPSCA